MNYPHVLRAVAEMPWAISPAKLLAMVEVLEVRASGERFSEATLAARLAAAGDVGPREGMQRSGAVAVIPVYGVISQRLSMMSEMSGGTSTERVAKALRAALADPSVGSVVLDVDSPGGGVYGVAELADEIARSRGGKPIVAVANSEAASAAYWIASAADELVVTPSGEVGSIGVFAVHWDESAANESLGLRPTLISAGKYKVEGSPHAPLSEEAREAFQGRVNEYYSAFTAAVAKFRGVAVDQVRGGFGEGRVVGAKQALKLGMADRIDTLDGTIARLAKGGYRRPRRAGEQAAEDDAPALLAEYEAAHYEAALPSAHETDAGHLELRRRRLRLHEAAVPSR